MKKYQRTTPDFYSFGYGGNGLCGCVSTLLIERLDPLFMGYAIFGLFLLEALAGAVIASLFFARRISK
jgi:hypothetical protein